MTNSIFSLIVNFQQLQPLSSAKLTFTNDSSHLIETRDQVMSDTLLNEKWRIFSMPLTNAELGHISTCRKGILGAGTAGSCFGFFCGRIALGPSTANLIVKALVMGSKKRIGVSCREFKHLLSSFYVGWCFSWFWIGSSAVFCFFESATNTFGR